MITALDETRRALEDAGVPIGSEPGLGYFLAPGYHLPPVMFTNKEARALLLGGKLVEKFSDLAVNRHYACASCIATSSNVLISARIRVAMSISSMAAAAPVPSPRRNWRSSSGFRSSRVSI